MEQENRAGADASQTPEWTTGWSLVGWSLAAAAVLAHVLYLGQPVFIDERLVLQNAVAFLSDGTIIPVHTAYPTLFSYLVTPLVAVAGGWLQLQGTLPSWEALPLLWRLQPTSVALPARLVALFALLGTAAITGRLTRRWGGAVAGWSAALILLFTPGLLPYASYALPDTLAMFFTAVVLALSLSVSAAGGRTEGERRLFAAFGAAGLALSAKYSAAGVLAAPTVALLLAPRRRPGLVAKTRLLVACGGAVAAGFLIGSPSWIYATGEMVQGLAGEMVHAREGHLGASGVPLLGQLELLVRHSPILTVGGMAGAAVMWARKAPPDERSLGERSKARSGHRVAIGLLLGTLLVAATSRKQSLQYLYPAYPALAWFTGHATSWLLARRPRVAQPLLAAVGLALCIAVLAWGFPHVSQPSTLEETLVWIQEYAPEDARIAVDEFHLPELFDRQELSELATDPAAPNAPRLLEALARERGVFEETEIVHDTAWLRRTAADILLTSSSNYRRYSASGIWTALPPPTGDPLREVWEQRKTFYRGLLHGTGWRVIMDMETGSGPRIVAFVPGPGVRRQ